MDKMQSKEKYIIAGLFEDKIDMNTFKIADPGRNEFQFELNGLTVKAFRIDSEKYMTPRKHGYHFTLNVRVFKDGNKVDDFSKDFTDDDSDKIEIGDYEMNEWKLILDLSINKIYQNVNDKNLWKTENKYNGTFESKVEDLDQLENCIYIIKQNDIAGSYYPARNKMTEILSKNRI